jgi:hypothetical protein
VPTLILQGREDLRTPPEWSQRLAERIPGSHRIVIPGVGHSTVSDPRDCAAEAILRFVANRTPPKTCRRVQTGVPPVPSAPASFESLRGVSGYPRKVGRTLRAVLATIDDLDLVLSPATLTASGGGLRGGSWGFEGRRLILRDYQAVRGVTVSGGGDLTRSLTFRIAGPKAAKGTLVLSSRGLIGRAGGRPVALRLTSAQASVLQDDLHVRALAR